MLFKFLKCQYSSAIQLPPIIQFYNNIIVCFQPSSVVNNASSLNAAKKIMEKVLPEVDKAFSGNALDWVKLKEGWLFTKAEQRLENINDPDEDLIDMKANVQELISKIKSAREGDPDLDEKALWIRFKALKGECGKKIKELTDLVEVEEKEAKEKILAAASSGVAGGLAQSYFKDQAEKLRVVQSYKAEMEEKLEEKRKLERTRRAELRVLVQNLKKFETNVSTQKQVLKTIQQALVQVDELMKMWSKIESFFSELQAVMEGVTSKHIEKFVTVGKTVLKNKEDSAQWQLSEGYRKRLVSAGQTAAKSAVVLQLLTEVFCNISDKHLKPMTEEFSTYLTLSSTSEIQRAKEELDRRADVANAEIAGIVEKASDDFVDRLVGYEFLALTDKRK